MSVSVHESLFDDLVRNVDERGDEGWVRVRDGDRGGSGLGTESGSGLGLAQACKEHERGDEAHDELGALLGAEELAHLGHI